jgi:hypothetical protein
MLPEKLQAFLKKEGKLLNSYYVVAGEEGEPRVRMFDWEQYEMGRHKRYAEFLEACGHDTRDLLASMERLRAAAQDLREVGEFYSKQFDEEPFRFALKDLRETEEFFTKVWGEPLTPLEQRVMLAKWGRVSLATLPGSEKEQLTPMEAAMKRFEEEPLGGK